MPVLEHVVNLKTEVDLENVLQRFDYDHICLLALGFDPKTLSAEFSNVPSKVAFDEVDEALLYRNILPVSIWKLQRWLQIGEEKKLSKGLKIVDDFVYNCISSKREKLSSKTRVHSPTSKDKKLMSFNGEELNKFVYLHATLCETLRLYHPHLSTVKLQSNRMFFQAEMMLMKEQGSLFLSIQWEGWKKYGNSNQKGGFRSMEIWYRTKSFRLGKDLSFKHMKTVAINLLWNYQVEVVEGQTGCPSSHSIGLHVENGLK
ncbi:hypothetical protein QQP08_005947, partial [Theobroma cacao]